MLKTLKHGYNLLKDKFKDVGLKKKRSKHWHKVRQEFLKENPECAVCGTNKNLNVHHKKPFHLYPELELDKNNLVTLCMSKMECHLLIGHGGSFLKFNNNIESDIRILQHDLSHFKDIVKLAKYSSVKE